MPAMSAAVTPMDCNAAIVSQVVIGGVDVGRRGGAPGQAVGNGADALSLPVAASAEAVGDVFVGCHRSRPRLPPRQGASLRGLLRGRFGADAGVSRCDPDGLVLLGRVTARSGLDDRSGLVHPRVRLAVQLALVADRHQSRARPGTDGRRRHRSPF
jgi:hypothetical protein